MDGNLQKKLCYGTFGLTFVFLISLSHAQTATHPISQITPIDSDVNFNNKSITNIGSLGIGNTNPNQTLDVTGIIKASLGNSVVTSGYVVGARNSDTVGLGAFIIGSGDVGAALRKTSSENDIVFDTFLAGVGWGERFRITNAGRIGINASSPSYTLQVSGGDAYLSTKGAKYRVNSDGSGNIGWFASSSFGNGIDIDTGASTFGLNISQGGTQRITLKSDGTVGIGTTNPSTALDVNGNYSIQGSRAIAQLSGPTALELGGGFGSFNIYIGPSIGTAANVIARGSVGIGTTNPQQNLEVVGNINTTNVLVLNPNGAQGGQIPSNSLAIGYDSSQLNVWDAVGGKGFRLYDTTTSTARVLFSPNSNSYINLGSAKFGINETSPDYIFHVTGVSPRTFIEGTRNGDNVAYIMQALASDGTARGGGYYLQPGTTDASTYLGLSADNSNYHMVVTRQGRVGIGTTTPQDILEVIAGGAEGIHIRSASRPLIFLNMTGSATTQGWGIEVTNEGGCAGCLGFREDTKSGSVRFVIQNDTGNVGIGTMNPGLKLHVGSASKPSNSQNSLVGIYSDTSGKYLEVGDGSTLRFYLANDSNNMTFFINGISTVFDSPWGGDYFFKTGSGGVSTEKLIIKNGGNIGIGNTNPNRMLDLKDGSIQMRQNNGIFWWNSNIDNSAMGFINYSAPGGIGGNLIFGTNGGEDMRIDSDGDVGIGTTNPTQKLHLEGGAFRYRNSADKNLYLTTGLNLVTAMRIQSETDDGGSLRGLELRANPIILVDGDVGVQTTTPQSALHINGTGNTYLQLDVNTTALDSTDCDSEAERGRMIVDGSNVKMYVCYGTSGWKTLTPA
jgi:hypothetical protein